MGWFGGNKDEDPAEVDPVTGRRRRSAPPAAGNPGRERSPNAVDTGDTAIPRASDTAIPRGTEGAPTLGATAPAPPATNLLDSTAVTLAQDAAARQRKRALSGSLLMNPPARSGPPASLHRRALKGY